jgi:hypothetical protein
LCLTAPRLRARANSQSTIRLIASLADPRPWPVSHRRETRQYIGAQDSAGPAIINSSRSGFSPFLTVRAACSVETESLFARKSSCSANANSLLLRPETPLHAPPAPRELRAVSRPR